MKKKHILNILTFIATVLILFILLEFSLRIFYPQILLKRDHIEASIPMFQKGENIPWQLKPLTETRQRDIFGEYDVPIRINNLGLRDKDYDEELNSDIKKILLLGDSMTFGYGVEQEQSYPKTLEKLLGDYYFVINSGVGGYSPDVEYIYLKEKGLKLNPDVVILGLYVGNDITDLEFNNWIRLDEKDLPKKISSNQFYVDDQNRLRTKGDENVIKNNPFPILYGINVFLSYKSHAYIFFKERLKSLFYKLTGQEESIQKTIYGNYYNKDLELSWKKVEAILVEMNLLVKEKDKYFVIILIPSRDQFQEEKDNTYNFTNPNKRLMAFGKENNLIMIDLLPYFKGEDDPRDFYYKKDVHLNKEGHRFLAEKIYEKLKGLNLV